MHSPSLKVSGLYKSFTMHHRGGVVLPVLQNVSFDLFAGECLSLVGPSGSGKSTVARCVYGNYRVDAGEIQIRTGSNPELVNLPTAHPYQIRQLRERYIGYVSQFLRAIPRTPTLDVVMEPLLRRGLDTNTVTQRARLILRRLGISERLWNLPPATFSGGEQQRINLARGFAPAYPILVLDEPTASLDKPNRNTVIELIQEARAAGTAIIEICHDEEVRAITATRSLNLVDSAQSTMESLS
jgi:alpha-D-ribose 1-methylphosphonate 5-triphosphate synthase subunit PhnL